MVGWAIITKSQKCLIFLLQQRTGFFSIPKKIINPRSRFLKKQLRPILFKSPPTVDIPHRPAGDDEPQLCTCIAPTICGQVFCCIPEGCLGHDVSGSLGLAKPLLSAHPAPRSSEFPKPGWDQTDPGPAFQAQPVYLGPHGNCLSVAVSDRQTGFHQLFLHSFLIHAFHKPQLGQMLTRFYDSNKIILFLLRFSFLSQEKGWFMPDAVDPSLGLFSSLCFSECDGTADNNIFVKRLTNCSRIFWLFCSE